MALVALILFRPDGAAEQPDGADHNSTTEAVQPDALGGYEATTNQADPGSLEVVPMPSAYLPILSLLGGGLLLMGWFGLSTGVHAPTAINFEPAYAAVSGLLAALAGGLTAAAYSWFTTQEFNSLMTSRGLAAGLVIATAGAPFVPLWIILVAALGLGLLLPACIYLFDRRFRLADDHGILTTFGLSAVISLLLVGFFASGQAGQGWNGIGLVEYRGVVGQGVSGLIVAPGLAADWPGQMQAQLIGIGVIIIWGLITSALSFQIAKAAAAAWESSRRERLSPTQADPTHPVPDPSGDMSEGDAEPPPELAIHN